MAQPNAHQVSTIDSAFNDPQWDALIVVVAVSEPAVLAMPEAKQLPAGTHNCRGRASRRYRCQGVAHKMLGDFVKARSVLLIA